MFPHFLWLPLGLVLSHGQKHRNPSEARRGGEEAGKTRNLGEFRPSGQLSICRMSIMMRFWATISSQWFTCSFKTSLGRPIAGVSCPQAERSPHPASCTRRYGATWPMECMFSVASHTSEGAPASVSTAPGTAERAAAFDGFAQSLRLLLQ